MPVSYAKRVERVEEKNFQGSSKRVHLKGGEEKEGFVRKKAWVPKDWG